MKVNLLCYEPEKGWILWDYAEKLAQHLTGLVDQVGISPRQLPGHDVTFHINYAGMGKVEVPGVHTTMVTHIDEPPKLNLVSAQARGGIHGICMSEHTARMLRQLTGVNRFSSLLVPTLLPRRQHRTKVLVSSRLYPDGRKNELWVRDFCRQFAPANILLRIMGAGWDAIVRELQEAGYQIEYQGGFDKSLNCRWLEDTDYVLYTGFDEGALSVLDAMAYGVTPIATAQGFHLELPGKMLLFSTREQLMTIAREIETAQCEKDRVLDYLHDWDGYAGKLVEVWRELLAAS